MYMIRVVRAVVVIGSMLLYGVSHAAVLTEDFEAGFPAWESGWLGTNSNLENYYVTSGNPNTYRGNNPDGLWLSDADGVVSNDTVVDIAFDTSFGSSLTSLYLDIAGFTATRLQIYDIAGAILLDINPITVTGGAYTDPGNYANYGTTSGNGIGGFRFLLLASQIEGNTSIDNIVVNQRDGQIPAPATVILLSLGIAGIAYKRRMQAKAA